MAILILSASLPGRRYGHLTIIEEVQSRPNRDGWLIRYVLCRCGLCGGETTVRLGNLRSGNTLSCGCLSVKVARQRFLELAKTRRNYRKKETTEYKAWQNMKTRCYSATAKEFPRYGGRGITICDRWRHSFENFLADMGLKPTPKHSLDRIKNDLGYSPDNCEWRTIVQQNQNTRGNVNVTYRGETLCVSEWARRAGLNMFTLVKRMQNGWDFDRAMTTPPRASWNTENRMRNAAGASAALLY